MQQSSVRFAVITLATIVAAAGVARAQSQGPNFVVSAATITDDSSIGTISWSAPGQAATSNNVYANVNLNAGEVSHYLKATGFGFSIPPTAVVLGIEVDVEKQGAGGNAFDNAVRIVKGGAIGTTDRSDGSAWPVADTIITYGSPTDLWGETWTAADINGAGFGTALSAHDSVSGVLARVDAFSITVFYALCGDGNTVPPEQCDDGNTSNGDCCSSTCQYESAASPCADDGLPCTRDECNGSGTCAHVTGPRTAGCRTSLKGILVYKDNATDNSKDKLTWKWIKGQSTTFAELGVPTGTTDYTLCLYAGTATALGKATVPWSATLWKVIGANKGYKYKDANTTQDGIKKVVLKTSAANKSKALVKGKGGNLPDLPAMPFALPVTAQLVNSSNNVCFTTVFNTPKKNIGGTFKAKSP